MQERIKLWEKRTRTWQHIPLPLRSAERRILASASYRPQNRGSLHSQTRVMVSKGKLPDVSKNIKVSSYADLTSATLDGVWSAGPVLSSRARNFTEPVNGMRSILIDIMGNVLRACWTQAYNWSSTSDWMNYARFASTNENYNSHKKKYLRTSVSSRRRCQGLMTFDTSPEALRATTLGRSMYW
jgi:hypothetical protein